MGVFALFKPAHIFKIQTFPKLCTALKGTEDSGFCPASLAQQDRAWNALSSGCSLSRKRIFVCVQEVGLSSARRRLLGCWVASACLSLPWVSTCKPAVDLLFSLSLFFLVVHLLQCMLGSLSPQCQASS